MLEPEDAAEQLMRCVRWDASFGWLAGCVDLDEHRDAPSKPRTLALQLESKAFSVERVHQMHQWRDSFDFVRLEPADKVPANGQMSQPVVFCDELLRVVFANVGDAGVDCSSDALRRLRLTDGYDGDCLWIATDTSGTCSDLSPESRDLRFLQHWVLLS